MDVTSVLNNGAVSFSNDWKIPMNLLLSGRDAVAVDSVGAELLGIPFNRTEFLKIAGDKNLGCNQIKEIEILPNRNAIADKKIKLNDIFDEIKEFDMPENFRIISGKGHKGCRAGCRGVLEYCKLIAAGGKILLFIGICGRGHNVNELKNVDGLILVMGDCAINELKDYFEDRVDRENIDIYYINGHFAIVEFMKPFRKASKISLKQLSTMLQLSFFKIISGMIGAKLHRANFRSMFDF